MSHLSGRTAGLRRRRSVRIAAAFAVLVVIGAIAREYRYWILARHFRVVEEGALYRGGRQTPPVLRRIIRRYGIRTIVNLDDKAAESERRGQVREDPYRVEKAMAERYGIDYYSFCWKGSGIAPFDEYDRVADILASTASRPVFFHCAAGKKRSNAALAAYWIRHRNYSFEQVVERLEDEYWLVPAQKPDFLRHLRRYCEYVARTRRPAFPASRAVDPQTTGPAGLMRAE